MKQGIDCKGKEWKEKIKTSPKLKDLSKQKFGRLQPLFVVEGKPGETLWLCQCECGNVIVVERRNLENNHSSSCGCYRKDMAEEKRIDKNSELIGKKFGKLTVKSYEGRFNKDDSKYKHSYHNCICDCGNEITVRTSHLISGAIQSCGCIRKEKVSKLSAKNLIGEKFGLLTVIKLVGSNDRQLHLWECECSCGERKIVDTNSLTSGKVKSCGCLKHSYGEVLIQNILKENNIVYKKEYCFPDLISKSGGWPRYDFAIIENNKPIRLIEFDGEQHITPKEFFWRKEKF